MVTDAKPFVANLKSRSLAHYLHVVTNHLLLLRLPEQFSRFSIYNLQLISTDPVLTLHYHFFS